MTQKPTQQRWTAERTEMLMLLAVFGDAETKTQARTELNARRDRQALDPLPEEYFTNIGIIAC